VVDDVEGLTGVVGNGQVTNDSRPLITGTGEPGATINIYNGEALAGDCRSG
jgi:hypothetical protein